MKKTGIVGERIPSWKIAVKSFKLENVKTLKHEKNLQRKIAKNFSQKMVGKNWNDE